MKTIPASVLEKATDLIQKDDHLIYDVAGNAGQIVENVKDTSWFRYAVAEQILADDAAEAAYQKLVNKNRKRFDTLSHDCPGAWFGSCYKNEGSITVDPAKVAWAVLFLAKKVQITETFFKKGEESIVIHFTFDKTNGEA